MDFFNASGKYEAAYSNLAEKCSLKAFVPGPSPGAATSLFKGERIMQEEQRTEVKKDGESGGRVSDET